MIFENSFWTFWWIKIVSLYYYETNDFKNNINDEDKTEIKYDKGRPGGVSFFFIKIVVCPPFFYNYSCPSMIDSAEW